MIRRSAFAYSRNYWIARVLEIVGALFLWPAIRLLQHRRRHDGVGSILFVRLDGLGDVLLDTPAIHALRELYPNARLSCLIKPAAEPILANNRDVDDLIFLDAPWHPQNHSWFRKRDNRKRAWRMVRELRRRRFDLVVHPKAFIYHWDNLLIALSGAPRRVGYGHKGGSFLLTDCLYQEEEKHVIESGLDMVRHLGGAVNDPSPRFTIPDRAREVANDLLREAGVESGEFLVCLSPTASHKLIWTNEGFAEVGRWLIDRWNAKIVLVGMERDAAMLEDIRDRIGRPVITLIGATDIPTLAAVLERVNLLVGVCSLNRHLAAAVGTPVVFLRHGGDPRVLYSPHGERQWMVYNPVSCAPCGMQNGCEEPCCMKGITAAQVISEIESHASVLFNRHDIKTPSEHSAL